MRLDELNPAQRVAASTIEGPVLILAGAGTGKTRTVTGRVCHLLRCGVRPEQILAVTFTNKASKEMMERIEKSTGKEKAKKLTVCTFHSLCVRILRANIDRLGYKRNFAIYTGNEQIGLIRRIIVRQAAKGEKLEPELAISLISRQRNKGIPADPNPEALVNCVAREYFKQLKLLNAVDFDDLLVLALKVLEEHQDVREAWQARFRHIMVDEFQDTNKLQMDLLRNLVGPHRNICVVGDDDQSIYGWRGAEIENILCFERFFANPTVVTLEENYRSTNNILNCANGLIRHNIDRHPKKLWSGKSGDDPVRLIAMPDDTIEAEWITDELIREKNRYKIEFDDFAILFRTNSQTRVFEENLRRKKVPYRVVGTKSFFDRREIKDVLAFLHMLTNPDDDINLLRIVNCPPRGIGDTAIEEATAMSQRRQESIWKTITSGELGTKLPERSVRAFGEFVALIQRYQDALSVSSVDVAALAEEMIKEIEYIPWLKKQTKDAEEAGEREVSVKELMDSIRKQNVRDEPGLIDFLGSISLDDSREDSSADKLEKQKGVTMITVHASKGLEFPRVYVPGLEEGILPHKRSTQEGTKTEERRLLYVAITRAMKKLTMTFCTGRTRYGQRMPAYASSFIKELAPETYQKCTWEEMQNRPVSLEDMSAGFAALREKLLGQKAAG